MLLSDLPNDVQEQLTSERLRLHVEWKRNDAYHILFTNIDGTRYFEANRISESSCFRGYYMPFGGGSYWEIKYGKIKWSSTYDNLSCSTKYYWKCTRQVFRKSTNGTVIPQILRKKKDVLEVAKSIGIFDI